MNVTKDCNWDLYHYTVKFRVGKKNVILEHRKFMTQSEALLINNQLGRIYKEVWTKDYIRHIPAEAVSGLPNWWLSDIMNKANPHKYRRVSVVQRVHEQELIRQGSVIQYLKYWGVLPERTPGDGAE